MRTSELAFTGTQFVAPVVIGGVVVVAAGVALVTISVRKNRKEK